MQCTLDVCYFWLNSVWSNRLEITEETRASLRLMAYLQSADVEQVREASKTFNFFHPPRNTQLHSSYLFVVFSFYLWCFLAQLLKISPYLLTLPELSLPSQAFLSYLQRSLLFAEYVHPISFAFPHFHHCLSLPFLPLSLLLPLLCFSERGLYQQAWMVQVHWKHRQWAHHQREAEPLKEEQRPSAQEGPHSHHLTPPQQQPPLALHTVCVYVCVCLCVCACVRAWEK